MAEDSELTKEQAAKEAIDKAVDHIIETPTPGSANSTTYKWRSDRGTKLYVVVSVDEFGDVNGMFINVGESGTTMHNVCNALGRVISIAIQNDKATLLQIIDTLEDVSSESVWMNDHMGRVGSIPSVISAILEHHIKLEEALEGMHTGEEDEILI